MASEPAPGTAELTPEAKAAIQSYMLKFAIPSSALIAIISGVFGYVLNGLARIDATQKAAEFALYSSKSAAMAEASAAEALKQVNKASDEANTARERANKAALASEQTAKTLQTASESVKLVIDKQYDDFAKALFAIKGFRESLGTVAQSELSDTRAQIKKIESAIYGGAITGTPTSSGICPPGTYVSGITAVSAPGGRSGFVESISVQCKALRFEQPK